MTESEYEIIPPNASILLQSLRGMGYTPETAIADVVDNSISAGAKNIEITINWDGDGSFLTILDDGQGMTRERLIQAMRLGDINSTQTRRSDDLGRFGLGMKTASFSQCKCLTVSSISSDGKYSCFRWDLDELVNRTDGAWALIKGCTDGDEFKQEVLKKQGGGTLVIWDKLDKLFSTDISEQRLLNILDSVESHLSMVFHLFLEEDKLNLSLNGKKLKPIDPFLADHPAKIFDSYSQKLPFAKGERMHIHVLPDFEQLTESEINLLEGSKGLLAHQGFYIYRNRRILVAGDWLGLFRRDPRYNAIRIKVEITPNQDDIWQIDILKSKASAPPHLRGVLSTYAENAMRRLEQAVPKMSRENNAENNEGDLWHSTEKGGFKVNRLYPPISVLLDNPKIKKEFEFCLKLLEQNPPVREIWADDPSANQYTDYEREQLIPMLKTTYGIMVNDMNMNKSEALRRIRLMEPFKYHLHVIDEVEF
ncbi:ATP-binding protein [Vibrio breoganii]|uniref:ATP-binding protein n=1 Tax=Vibrio breoganii TaxID=553239 RepID=UPI000C8502D6|nr:ATP-binding protein [Vibrio breoganii]PMK37660.1 hypothetical protein BCU00_18040 [Vibrio breoganii]